MTLMASTWKRKSPEARGEISGRDQSDRDWDHQDAWYGDDWQDGDSYQPYDGWEDQRWDGDDDDEEYETATAAELSEAYAAGWKAKAQTPGYRQARGYKQQPTQRRQRGVDKRSQLNLASRKASAEAAADMDIGEVIRNVLMSRQAEFLCTTG